MGLDQTVEGYFTMEMRTPLGGHLEREWVKVVRYAPCSCSGRGEMCSDNLTRTVETWKSQLAKVHLIPKKGEGQVGDSHTLDGLTRMGFSVPTQSLGCRK